MTRTTQTRGTIANVRTTLTATTNIVATVANSMAEAIDLHGQAYMVSAKADIVNDQQARFAERTDAVTATITEVKHTASLAETAESDWEKSLYARLQSHGIKVVEGMVDAAI